MEGSEDETCDDSGQCNCKCNVKGEKCGECNSEYYSFPDCHGTKIIFISNYFLNTNINSNFLACECNVKGAVDDFCDDAGKCSCKPMYGGDKCDQCDAGYYGFPECQGNYNTVGTFIKCHTILI